MRSVTRTFGLVGLVALLGGCTLVNTGPTASFIATPVVIYAGDPVTFDGSDSSGSSSITTYQWDLGNGQLTAGEWVTTTFDEPGTYTVVLVVVDADGRSDAVEKQVTVYMPSGTILLSEDFSNGLDSLDEWPLDPTWASANDGSVTYLSSTVGYALHIRSAEDRWHRRYAAVSLPPLRVGQHIVFTCHFMAGQTQDNYTFIIVPMRKDVATSAGSLPYFQFTSDCSYLRHAPTDGPDVGHPVAFTPNAYRWHELTFDYGESGYTLTIDGELYQSGNIGESFADGGDWYVLLGEESFNAECNVYYDDIELRIDE